MKILIVDDEVLICEWLEFCISQNPAYSLVGVAHNGREALDIFVKTGPDIVLTDIKMPIMDGLALLDEIKKRNAKTAVVLLTAFSEFELARKAMRSGAAEYLLKTEIDKNSLNQVLEKAYQRHMSAPGSSYHSNAQNLMIIRNLLFFKKNLDEEDLDKLKEYGLNWKSSGLFMIAVWSSQMLNGFSLPQNAEVRVIFEAEHGEGIYLILGDLSHHESTLYQINCLSDYAAGISRLNACAVGVSQLGSDIRSSGRMITEAVSALEQGFYEGLSKPYYWSGDQRKPDGTDKTFQKKADALMSEYLAASTSKQLKLVRQAIDYFIEYRVCPLSIVRNYCNEIINHVVNDKYNIYTDADIAAALKNKIDKSVNMTELAGIFLPFAEEHIKIAGDDKLFSAGVVSAIEYILEHYMDSITLDQIAASVYLNPEYLSRIFKAEVGRTYTEFITELRIKKAARMLCETSRKVQDIGKSVGYPNVSYFSTLFKKKMGKNPFEYRRDSRCE